MTFAVVVLTFALGSFVQAIAGFGSALVIMPILTYFIGIKTATTVVALVGGTVILVVLHQNWRGFRWGEAMRLMTGTVIGIPLGTLALKYMPPAPIMALLGLILLMYGAYWLASGKVAMSGAGAMSSIPGGTAKSAAVGFVAGLLGGAYATDGPPLVVYGSSRGWSKESFRSILQAVFLVDGILIILCHGAGGMVTRDVLIYCLYGIPGMALGLASGIILDKRINHARFHRMLLWLIIILGIALLMRAFVI